MIDATGMPQSVVVLGATSDLARSLLRELARRRMESVVLCGRDLDALEDVAEELRGLGVAEAATARFDASVLSGFDELAGEAKRRLGTVDLVVVASGVLGTAALDELDAARVANELTVNFTGAAAAMTAFAQLLRAQGHGRLLVYSSIAGIRVRKSNFVYGAAKAGLDGFACGLGDALVGSGVSVTVVRPGFVHTKMTAEAATPPLASTAEQVTAEVLRGLERNAAVVTVPRALQLLGLVFPLVPRAIWRRLPF